MTVYWTLKFGARGSLCDGFDEFTDDDEQFLYHSPYSYIDMRPFLNPSRITLSGRGHQHSSRWAGHDHQSVRFDSLTEPGTNPAI
jgi:hypothetical protein